MPLDLKMVNNPEDEKWFTDGPIGFPGGFKYYGYLKNGVKNGIGKQVWPDYGLYEG